MQAPDSVEVILARLMPPGLSENFQADLDEMISGLAGPDAVGAMPRKRSSYPLRLIAGGGIAAAIGALCALVPMIQGNSGSTPTAAILPPPAAPGLVLLGESNRVESITEEGWKDGSSGAAIRATRLNVVEQNSVRDEKSGMVVEIVEPREEILLTPIDSF